MQYSQTELLLFYFVVVICVVASFIAIRKKPRDPVKLRLQSTNKKPIERNQSQQATAQAQVNQNSRVKTQTSYSDSRKEKTLNAFFEFNGKKYDGYEVLGLPAGASIKSAQSAFNAQFVSAETGQRALLKAALEAIRTR